MLVLGATEEIWASIIHRLHFKATIKMILEKKNNPSRRGIIYAQGFYFQVRKCFGYVRTPGAAVRLIALRGPCSDTLTRLASYLAYLTMPTCWCLNADAANRPFALMAYKKNTQVVKLHLASVHSDATYLFCFFSFSP